MTLLVTSSRLGAYRGADALNITRTTGTTVGLLFAPSYKILRPMLARRRSMRGYYAGPGLGEPQQTAQERAAWEWAGYVEAYTAEMRASYRKWRHVWEELLSRKSVCLQCFCINGEHCHRQILRGRILPKLGATDGGELTAE